MSSFGRRNSTAARYAAPGNLVSSGLWHDVLHGVLVAHYLTYFSTEGLRDNYQLSTRLIKEPPGSFRGRLRFLGPGFILSALVIGSGELIATTTLGARAGFVAFWVILVSCLVKVAVQIGFARHAILTGETPIGALNTIPGPRIKSLSWSIWTVSLVILVKLLQFGGIIGGVAIILNMLFTPLSPGAWALLAAALVGALIFRGRYTLIERGSLVLIVLFTIITIVCLWFLQNTSYAISGGQILSGLRFDLPQAAVPVAIGAFGITGMGGSELLYYNYWCLEKGYAAYTGPDDGSTERKQRALGWIRVMQLDVILAMIVYTIVTAAFYLLGASVLHARGDIPQGYEMITSLSTMYTETLGSSSEIVFLVGALAVLFSTLFGVLASWTRLLSDLFHHYGLLDFYNASHRHRAIAWLAWTLPVIWAILFIFIRLPVAMVVIGGISGSVLLLVVLSGTIFFRLARLPQAFRPKLWADLVFWGSAVAILVLAILGLAKFF